MSKLLLAALITLSFSSSAAMITDLHKSTIDRETTSMMSPEYVFTETERDQYQQMSLEYKQLSHDYQEHINYLISLPIDTCTPSLFKTLPAECNKSVTELMQLRDVANDIAGNLSRLIQDYDTGLQNQKYRLYEKAQEVQKQKVEADRIVQAEANRKVRDAELSQRKKQRQIELDAKIASLTAEECAAREAELRTKYASQCRPDFSSNNVYTAEINRVIDEAKREYRGMGYNSGDATRMAVNAFQHLIDDSRQNKQSIIKESEACMSDRLFWNF